MKQPKQRRSSYRSRGRRASLAHVGRAVRFVLVFGLLWGGGYAFSRYLRESEHYRVKRIRVDGTWGLSPETVIEASSITTADNILFLNPREVAGRVESLPQVKSCSVTRIFPDVVALSIVERYPLAAIVVNNRIFEVDETGMALEEIMPGEDYYGPLITLYPPLGTIALGEPVERPGLLKGLSVWRAFSKTDMAAEVEVSELAVFNANDIRMYCDDLDFEIRWGRGGHELQAERLDILWKELAGSLPCTEYLDLRFGRDLACK